MSGTVGFVVKTVKQELEVNDTLFQSSNALAFSIFI
jgi:hypothetical protein